MSNLALKTSSGGAVTLVPDTSSDNVAITLPAHDGIAATSKSSITQEPQVYQQAATQGGCDNALIWDAAGNLYWAVASYASGTLAANYTQVSYVYKITPQGQLSAFASATTTGGRGNALAWDAAGNLYWSICNYLNGTTYDLTSYVYKITPAGAGSVFASVITKGGGDSALSFDASGNLYWAVVNNASAVGSYTQTLTSYVYRITPAGAMTTRASVTTYGAVGTDLTWDASGNLYWAVANPISATNTWDSFSYVYKITPAGALSLWASAATLGCHSVGLTWDTTGNLYWAVVNLRNNTDYFNTSYVYKITPAGAMTTFASVGTIAGGEVSLTWDATGNLYWAITSQYNGTGSYSTSYIYRITPAGALSTFASVATIGGNGSDLTWDAAGNLYWGVNNSYNGTSYAFNSYIYRISRQTIQPGVRK